SKLYRVQKHHKLGINDFYARIGHLQYAGFVALMFGFLLLKPTIVTIVIFSTLVFMYTRLAKPEET
ncbi:MAG: isoprenylcysteine carboxylmethyltransferase family protein, partial [Candidatus Levybacteria bacterium]|nr:isoprenylcysteine carboxylmethyltransferase family protein [Candidatus Levybacteria bacterium]